MALVSALPTITARHVPYTAPGLAISPGPTLVADLRNSLPASTVDALDALVDQIEKEVIDPLLCTETVEEMRHAFQERFSTFQSSYIGLTLVLWAALGEDRDRFIELTERGFDELRAGLVERGTPLLGEDAAAAAALALDGVARIARAAVRLLNQTDQEISPPEKVLREWTASIIASVMTLFAVHSAVTRGDQLRGRHENVVLLARWAVGYATKAFDASKRLGLLRPASAPGPIPDESDDDEILLANAGLDEFARGVWTGEGA